MIRTSNSLTVPEHGFTLVELMIVMAILAIIITVALPSYQQHVTRANRADAQATLLAFGQAMERHFSQGYTYTDATLGNAATPAAPAPDVFPSRAPIDGDALYELTIEGATEDSYVLQAKPIAGSRQSGDGFLRLNHLGQKSWDKDNSGSITTAELTWDR
ncbi:MAG: prepilin-type N-terminal cleavage/methylation domain-containing protein [Haliea sp.]|jgi:type IV pilus assembly protein PilE|nr:prepilin-type N-terminal cleavage/methylation domain-containing protein [Haliea sp.]MDP5063893.1 prepilin-type N-terminal cleavage/methylation domain-containing protein [Haliea sp.]